MITKKVPTFIATIYVGQKNRATGKICSYSTVTKTIQDEVNIKGLCVTITPTEYYYASGSEKGIIVGLINYPRFPKTPSQIKTTALNLAELLREKCKQLRVSVVFPDETVMLSKDGLEC